MSGLGPHHEGELIVVRGTVARTPGILWQRSNHAMKDPSWVDAEVIAVDTQRIVVDIDGDEHVFPSRADIDAYNVEIPAFAKVSTEKSLLSILLPVEGDTAEVLLVDIGPTRVGAGQ